MDIPRVSAVIPVYNGETYIQQAVTSMLKQTFRELEIIVVDDGSTDRSVDVVAELASRDSRLRLHRCAHRGAIESFNFGAQQARGEYLAWLGADDIALSSRLARQVTVLDSRPDVAVVGTAVTAVNPELRPMMVVRYPTDDAGIRELLRTSNPIAAPSALMRASAYAQLGGVRAAFSGGAEDYDLWLRMAERHQLSNIPDPLILYRVHGGQVSQTRSIAMILSMVAAQVGARRRQSGRSDGLDGREGVSYELVRGLEPDTKLLNESLLMTASVQATFMALVGNPAAALDLLMWAESTGRGTRLSRTARTRAALARAIAAWRKRDLAMLASAGMTAVVTNPMYVGTMLARALVSSRGVLTQREKPDLAVREPTIGVPH